MGIMVVLKGEKGSWVRFSVLFFVFLLLRVATPLERKIRAIRGIRVFLSEFRNTFRPNSDFQYKMHR